MIKHQKTYPVEPMKKTINNYGDIAYGSLPQLNIMTVTAGFNP